jgi:hypothetical protein
MKRFCILLVAIAVFGAMSCLLMLVPINAYLTRSLKQTGCCSRRYFVAFRDALTENDKANVRATGARVNGEFPEVRAVAVKVRNEQQLASLQRNPRVEYVEAVLCDTRWVSPILNLYPQQVTDFTV